MDAFLIKLTLLALATCQFATSQANCFSLKEVVYEDEPVKLFPERTYYESNEDMAQLYKYTKKHRLDANGLTKQSVDAYLDKLDRRLKKRRQPELRRAYLILRELSQFDRPCTRRTLDLLRHFGVYEFNYINQANNLVGYLLDQASRSCEAKLDGDFNHLLTSEAFQDKKLFKLEQSLLNETILNLNDKEPISRSSRIEMISRNPDFKLSHKQIVLALIESSKYSDSQSTQEVAESISSDPTGFYVSNLVGPCEKHRSLVKDILELGEFMWKFEAQRGDFWSQRPEQLQGHKLTLEYCKQLAWTEKHLVEQQDFKRLLDVASKFGI